jgi:hypothetical protein
MRIRLTPEQQQSHRATTWLSMACVVPTVRIIARARKETVGVGLAAGRSLQASEEAADRHVRDFCRSMGWTSLASVGAGTTITAWSWAGDGHYVALGATVVVNGLWFFLSAVRIRRSAVRPRAMQASA